MMLLNSYNGITVKKIEAMSHEELIQSVIRLLKVETHKFAEDDSWSGVFLMADELADAFRGIQ